MISAEERAIYEKVKTEYRILIEDIEMFYEGDETEEAEKFLAWCRENIKQVYEMYIDVAEYNIPYSSIIDNLIKNIKKYME